jgi:hypothetical protein
VTVNNVDLALELEQVSFFVKRDGGPTEAGEVL